MINFVKYLLLLCNLIQVTNAVAQTEGLSPDRPGFLTGTYVVNRGIYLETGYQYSVDRNNHKTAYSAFPNINIRFGLAEKLEMFVMWEGWKIAHISESESDVNLHYASNINSIGLGWKYGLTSQHNFNIVFLGAIEGIDLSGALCVEPSLAVAWDYSLGNKYSLYGMEQVVYEKSEAGNSYVVVSGIGFTTDFTSQLQSFVEYYNLIYSTDQRISHGCEFGLTYLLSKNIQIDIYGGFMLNNEAVNYIGLGFSRMFNNKKNSNNLTNITNI